MITIAHANPYAGQFNFGSKKGRMWLSYGSGLFAPLGNLADIVGTALNLPEWGVSEALAAGPTVNTKVFGVSPATSNNVAVNKPFQTSSGNTRQTTSQSRPSTTFQSQSQPANTAIASGDQRQNVDPYAQIKAGLSSAWDEYINSLGGMQSGLEGQRTAQENILGTQLQQGLNTMSPEKVLQGRKYRGRR